MQCTCMPGSRHAQLLLVVLQIQEGYLAGGGQHSRHNLTLSLTTFIDMPDNHPSEETYRVHQVNVPISLVIRSFGECYVSFGERCVRCCRHGYYTNAISCGEGSR